jgi:PAS domain-containing protein
MAMLSPPHPDSAQAVAFVEAHLGSLFDFLPAPLLMTDADGLIVRTNTAAERVLDRHDLLGQRVGGVLPFVNGPNASDAWLGRLPGGDGATLQVRHTSLGCPPATIHLYVLEDLSAWRPPVTAHAVSAAAPRRSRSAPFRAAQTR